MFNIYFDYKVVGNGKIKIGIYMEDDGVEELLDFVIVEANAKKGNPSAYNLDYALMAFKQAIVTAEEYGLDGLRFINQNELIFTWVLNDERDKRKEVGQVVDGLNRITLKGIESEYKVVKSAKNKAKKKLDKVKKNTGGKIGLIGKEPKVEVNRPKKKGVSVTDIITRSKNTHSFHQNKKG